MMAVTATGLSANSTEAPTVTKTASPTDITLAGTGPNDETTVTITVTGAGGTSTTTIPMDVVFALDSSGSMSWNDPGGQRKNAAKSFVDLMNPANDYAGVVSWDSGIDFTYGLSQNFPTVKSQIDAVNASGGTNLNAGLNASIAMLDASSRTPPWARVIIFLTDGQGAYTYAGSGGPASVAASKGYVIYSIGLGPANMGPLNDMANATGGQAFSSPSPANLNAIFSAIFTQVISSTVPHNVDVVEVTQSYIQVDTGSFNIPPTSVTVAGSGETTIVWSNIGMYADSDPDLSADETVTLTFQAKSNQAGSGLDVQVAGSAKVDYTDKDGNTVGSVPIPQAQINVNTPPVAVCQDITLNLDASGQATLTAADVDGGSSDPDGDPITLSIDKTSFTCADIGPNTVTLTVSDGQATDTCQATVTVVDAVPPTFTLSGDNPQVIECCDDYVELGATAMDNCSGDVTADIVVDASSVDTCTVGTYTVTYDVSDAQGNAAAQVTRTVEVVDTTPPEVWCVESVNPHGNNVPGGKRPDKAKDKAKNPDGFYQLFAEDECSDAEDIEIWVSGFGPFKSGDVVKITEAPGATPSMKKIGSANGQADAVVAHLILDSDAVITAVDGNGNVGSCGDCLVPPPPK